MSAQDFLDPDASRTTGIVMIQAKNDFADVRIGLQAMQDGALRNRAERNIGILPPCNLILN